MILALLCHTLLFFKIIYTITESGNLGLSYLHVLWMEESGYSDSLSQSVMFRHVLLKYL